MTNQDPTQQGQPASQPNVTMEQPDTQEVPVVEPDPEGFGDKDPDDSFDAEDEQS